MVLQIKPIESEQEWEQFMAKVKVDTFLHSWCWGEFQEKMGNKIFRLGVFREHVLVALSLILVVRARRGSFLFCPHGPIISTDVSSQEVLSQLTVYLKELAKTEACDFIRLSPLMEKTQEDEKLFHTLHFREAPIHMHPELAWILDLTPSEEDLLKNMRKTTRYCIKKAEKDGVEIVVSSNPDDIEDFWKVYKETVDRQHFTPFSKAYLRTEFEIFQKQDGARFFFAKYNNEIVATAMIIFYQGSAFYHHGASTHKYPKITAPYLLQWAVIKEAKKRACHSYNFWGISPDDQPKHPWAGLSLFKKGFGGTARPYIHAKDFVITPKFWLSWIIETARRMKRGL